MLKEMPKRKNEKDLFSFGFIKTSVPSKVSRVPKCPSAQSLEGPRAQVPKCSMCLDVECASTECHKCLTA